MKKLLLALILFSSINSYGQLTLEEIKADKNYGWFQYFEAIGRFGSILAHHEEMVDLTKNPFQALEIRAGWQSYGDEDFQQKLNYPSYGIGIYTSWFHSKGIGNPSALFGWIDFPFLRGKNNSRFNTSLGVGISYAFNSFDKVDNPENIAIGSFINVYFSLGLNYQWNINEKWAIKPGVNFSHFSNSSTVVPNLGLNMVDASIGVQYRFNPIKRFTQDKYPDYEPAINPTFIESVPDPIWKKHKWLIRAGAGVRQTDDTGDTFYGVGLATIGYQYQVNYVYKIGGGLDLMYDGSNSERYWGSKGLPVPNNANYTAGINVSNSLIIGRLELELQIGYYFWIQYDYSGVYLRPGFKYFISDNIFTMVSFKTEYIGQAQYIEWGFGFDIF
jgi:hypothetical protein